MKELIAGIDLGTTNSVLALSVEGRIEVIDIQGQPTMPSCVGLDASGRLLVGQTAKNQIIAAPDATILSIKRKMGENTRVRLGDQEFSPEEISSFILRELKQEAEKRLGQSLRKAVITVPAFFDERQRKATQIAGSLAGWEVVRIINEPTAAALAYGANRAADETMLVYDLGGGTFDVSVVVVEQGIVEVKASHGDTHLGGDDFDDLLVAHAIREFKTRHGVDLTDDSKVRRRLKVVLERAKCRLSDEPFVPVREEYLDGQHHLEMELDRRVYEEMIEPFLQKTLTCIHQGLKDAKLTPKNIDKVMLVGGSTRTPLVHSLLKRRLELEPRWEINPDLIVAMGAAIQGAVIAGETHHSILVDITPHTFSTSSVGEFGGQERLISVPIIPRNTPLPASKSEVFFTIYDNQEEVSVEATQGENPLPEQNTLIGEFMVEGLSKVPSGNPVVVHFDLDLNGMLKVTATEKNTGLLKSVIMDTRGAHVLNLDDARRNLDSLLGGSGAEKAGGEQGESADDEQESEAHPEEALTTARDLRKRAEALIQKNLSVSDADEVRELLHRSAEAIKERNWPLLEKSNAALGDLLFYLED